MRISPRVAMAGIVLAQLLGCSLWFSVNAVGAGLTEAWGVDISQMGWLTGAVQTGFICGTLILAITGVADRFRASRLVLVAALTGAALNVGFIVLADQVWIGVLFRFGIGLCLAGIYPLGMKLIVTWSAEPPGMALGLLVGMLTLGTALPHGLVSLDADWQVSNVLAVVSLLACVAGLIVWVIGEGPHTRNTAVPLRFGAIFQAFTVQRFRGAALGYFGHMWELYAFWTLVPWLVALLLGEGATATSIALWSFCVIGVGSAGAIIGGWMSRVMGSERVAFVSLLASGAVCALYPLLDVLASWVSLLALLVWGFFVIADSAQFSALSAKACPPDAVGSALAMQNCLGFALSVVSILWVTHLAASGSLQVLWWLLPGPILGLWAMWSNFFGARRQPQLRPPA